MVNRKHGHYIGGNEEHDTARAERLISEADRLDDLAYRMLSDDVFAHGDWEKFSSVKKAAINKRSQAKRERERTSKFNRSTSKNE